MMKRSCARLVIILIASMFVASCSSGRSKSSRSSVKRDINASDAHDKQDDGRVKIDIAAGPVAIGGPIGIEGPGGFGPDAGFIAPDFLPPPPFFPIDDFGDDDSHHHDCDDEDCRRCNNIRCHADRLSLTGEGTSVSFANEVGVVPSGQLEIGFEQPFDLVVDECGEVSGKINSRATFLLTSDDPGCDGTITDEDCTPSTQRTFAKLACLEIDGDTAWFAGTVYAQDADGRVSEAEQAQAQQAIADGTAVYYGRIDDLPSTDRRSFFTTQDLVLQEGKDNAVAPIGGFGFFNLVSSNSFSAEEVCGLRDQVFETADYTVQCAVIAPGVCPTNPAFNECEQPTVNESGIGFADDGSFECWVNSTEIEWLNGVNHMPSGIVAPNRVNEIRNPPSIAQYTLVDDPNTFQDIDTGDFVISSTRNEQRCHEREDD